MTAVVLIGGGCLVALLSGVTVYLARRVQAQAAALRQSRAIINTIPAFA